jgi:hypothetical protein
MQHIVISFLLAVVPRAGAITEIEPTHVDNRAPSSAELGDWISAKAEARSVAAGPFVETLLVPAAELVKNGYAVVPEAPDGKGERALLAGGRTRVGRKAVCLLVEGEVARRARAAKVGGALRTGAAALGR